MNVNVKISGAGYVDGGGQHNSGDAITLVATPVSGNTFKYFIIDGNQILSNPYQIEVGDDDVNVECIFYTTIEDYLRGSVFFDIPDNTLNNIRFSRGIEFSQDISTLSKEKLDLSFADVLMFGATRPSSVSGSKDSDGGWSHTEGSTNSSGSDKIFLRTRALEIYKQYNDSSGSSSVVIQNLNGERFKVR